MTFKLLTTASGTKMGNTEKGAIWIDPEKTSPYKFYQFWLNASDDDAKKWIRIFTLNSKEVIEAMEKEHDEAPHLRPIQKALAEELTIRVHSREDYDAAVEASQILFGKGTTDTLKKLSEDMLLSVFEGVPQSEVPADVIQSGIGILEFLAESTDIFASKGEARRMIKDNAVSVNKEKIKEDFIVSEKDLLNAKYVLVQKGKKNYFLVRVV